LRKGCRRSEKKPFFSVVSVLVRTFVLGSWTGCALFD
jgi:hypothetical protein